MNLPLVSQRLFRLYCWLVGLSCLGISIQNLAKVDPGPVAPIFGILIMLSGAGVAALAIRDKFSVFAALIIGTLAELCGLYTGFPFGRYEYTDKWFPTVPVGSGHGFPLLLPLAWLMMVAGAFRFCRSWLGGYRLAIATAAVATLIDWPMERAMVSVLGYWKWLSSGPLFGAPVMNSVGWFLTSLIAASVLVRRDQSVKEQNAQSVVSLFCAFVAFNGAWHGMDVAWVLLLGFAAVGLWGQQVVTSIYRFRRRP